MNKRQKPSVGDIFLIKLNPAENCIGQILYIYKKMLLIAIYDNKIINKLNFQSSYLDSQILLFGWTLDAKFYHGHWEIINNYTKNISTIKLPYYKIGSDPHNSYIVDFKGTQFRKATAEEFGQLSYQKIRAPVGYENAAKTYFNHQLWDHDWDSLLYEVVLKSISVVSNR